MNTDKLVTDCVRKFAPIWCKIAIPGNVYEESIPAGVDRRNCKIARKSDETRNDDVILWGSRILISHDI